MMMTWLSVFLVTLAAAGQPLSPAGSDPHAAPADTGRTLFVVGPDGNEARYRVREQLARISFRSDAVGSTRRVQGQIVFDGAGRVMTDVSRFVVDLASLQTDQDRRDNYVRRNTLVTDSFPTLTLVPRQLVGLPFPLPTAGEHKFRMVTDMTLRGVTRPVTWDVTATFTPHGVSGLATTRFDFATFAIPVPRVASVLSVEDEIRLEYQFRLVESSVAAASR